MRAARLTPTTLYRHVISLAMIACAAVLAVLMFDSLMMQGASHRAAFATTLLLITAPPLLAYSILFFTELLSALLAFFAFVNVGLVIGLTLVAAFLWRGESRRQASGFFVGLVVMVVLRTAINHYLWGTWITTPHAAAGSWEGFRPTVGQAAMRMVAPSSAATGRPRPPAPPVRASPQNTVVSSIAGLLNPAASLNHNNHTL